ncbi:MAG: 50S ribosomal protein L10 [Gemmatimonadales bacterium]|nr:MAG: 50S ribosomal protein L10 [Gemmatimonadales bacterium]
MKRADKEAFVGRLKERLETNPTLYLTDFTGLDVKSMTRLRDDLAKAGAEYVVVKNRLMIRVLQEHDPDFPDLSEHLTGPTGVIISDDVVEPARALRDFSKDHDNRPAFKVGVMDRAVVDAGQFARLADLPSREDLLAQLAGAFEAPMAMFAMALESKLQETAGLLDALREKRVGEE